MAATDVSEQVSEPHVADSRHSPSIRWGLGSALLMASVAAATIGLGPLPAWAGTTPSTPTPVVAQPTQRATSNRSAAVAPDSVASTPVPVPAIDEGARVTDAGTASARRSTVQSPQTVMQSPDAPAGSPAAEPLVVEPAADLVRPLAQPVVVLYGDSLAWEAQHSFVEALTEREGLTVIVRSYGGTAICDWLDEMAADADELAPGAVVVEFSGNALTPCMQDGAGQGLVGTDYFERYASDAERVIATFDSSETQVIFAGAPISLTDEQGGAFGEGRLNPLYREVAERHEHVRYADAGAVVLDAGRWTTTLPCLPDEPCADQGLNVVRSSDGVHFCPAGAEAERGVTGECPVWSSGAFRYGRALAQPVIDSLDVAAPAS